ncbi:MAG: TadE/TadG family type IV pilus assembly protein [Pseudomonadota bacterium]
MKLRNLLRRGARSEDGTVTVEFLLIFPVLLGVLGIGFASFHAYLQFVRASKAMYTVSDIVARYEFIDDNKMTQLQQLYESFTTAPAGSVIRVSRLDYLEDDPLDPPTTSGYAANDGFYEVTWSLSAPESLDEPCTECGPGEKLEYELEEDELANYLLPTLGDGAHVILFEVFTPYSTPIPEGVQIGIDLSNVSWSMNHFVWPRGANGLSYDDGT